MARKTFSITMDEELIKRLDEMATQNHRRRGPEVNVAVEFYLKHYGMDLEPKQKDDSSKEVSSEEEATKVSTGEFSFN